MVLKERWSEIVEKQWATKSAPARWLSVQKRGWQLFVASLKQKGCKETATEAIASPSFMRLFLLPLLMVFVALCWAAFLWGTVESLAIRVFLMAMLLAGFADIGRRLRALLLQD